MKILHARGNEWPYSHYFYTNPIGLELCQLLDSILPHGSGINGTWEITSKYGKVYASNYYDAMNESGMYCHIHDFTAVYSIQPDHTFQLERINYHNQRERSCCSYGLHEYLFDTLIDTNLYYEMER